MDIPSAQVLIYKANFYDSDKEKHMLIARKMVEIANAAVILLYSQWLPGKERTVYDFQSHDHNMHDPDLIHMLCLFFPEQIAEEFTINQFPREIVSFIFSLVQKTPETMLSPKGQPRTHSGPGKEGPHLANTSD
jgi:hypothetical protein